MAEIQHQRIKSIYGEVFGLLSQLPLAKDSYYTARQVVDQYNQAVEDLGGLTASDYSRFRLANTDLADGRDYITTVVRTRMGALTKRLEEEFGLGSTQSAGHQTIVVTQTNNQTVSISVTPIQQIIEGITDEDLRQDVEQLKYILETSRDKEAVSKILNAVQQKSWDVFIALLPVVLQGLGQNY